MKEYVQKNIKPEDEVTITTKYGELTRVYAVMRRINGKARGKSLWNIASEVFHDSFNETQHNKYCTFGFYDMDYYDVLDYIDYQDKWEKHLFKQQKTEQEIQIEELEETIRKASEQIKKLKGE